MAVTTTHPNNEIQKWKKKIYQEWQRDNLFAKDMGSDNAVISRIYELKDEGEQITIPIVGKLDGSGASGAETLVGNEEKLDSYGHKLYIDWARNAVLLNKKEMRKSAFEQMESVRPALTKWGTSKMRDDIIKSLFNVGQGGLGSKALLNTQNVNGIYWPNATAGQRNAWVVANSDRVVFGNAVANNTGVASTSLANVDSTNDKFLGSSAKFLKRLAKKASPAIEPVTIEGGKEFFVAYCGSNAFRDFSNDPIVVAANKDARIRGVDSNPIFQDGDLIYGGVIVREIPEIDALCTLTGAGASSINVTPVFLCGKTAIGYVIGQMPAPTERNEDDYGFVKGRGVEMCYGMGKILYQPNDTSPIKDFAMVTGFFSSVDDA